MGRGQSTIDPASILYGELLERSPKATSVPSKGLTLEEQLAMATHWETIRKTMEEIEAEARHLDPNNDSDFVRRSKLGNRWVEEVLLPNTRVATIEDYQEWLGEWVKNGKVSTAKKPINKKDKPFDQNWENFYVATKGLITWPQHGSKSYNLIIPKDVNVEVRSNLKDNRLIWAAGHSNLFWEEGWRHQGPDVRIYTDISF